MATHATTATDAITVPPGTVNIEQHLDYVRALARGIHRALPARVEYDDLVQFGMVGLAEACQAFDARRGAAFRTFAYHRIRGAIFDGLAQLSGAAHTALRRHLIRAAALNSVGAAEAAAHDGDLDRAAQRVALVILLSELGSDDPQIPGPGVDPAESAARRELGIRVRGALGDLPPLECAVLRLHYFDGLTLTDCARRLGKHKAWISRLHARALDRLRAGIAA